MANPNLAITILGLAETRLLEFFDPAPTAPAVAPLGGGTDVVWQLAGDIIAPPPWVGIGESDDIDPNECDPYLWVRLVQRWRQGQSQNMTASSFAIPKCGQARGITIEAGIARCYPLDGTPEEMAQRSLVLLDDSWRMDLALCAAMKDAKDNAVAKETGIGTGAPFGPEALVLTWAQSAYAQF